MMRTTRKRLAVMAFVVLATGGSSIAGRGVSASREPRSPGPSARGRSPSSTAGASCSRPMPGAAASPSSTRPRARLLAEHDVGTGLADLAPLPDGTHLLAVDRAASAVLLLERRDRSLRVVSRVEVSPDPVRVVVAAPGPPASSPRAGRAA